MRNLSLGWRHLVNAYEVKAGIGVIACDPCVRALSVRYYKSALYKYTYLYLCALYVVSVASLLFSVETIASFHVVNPERFDVNHV